MRGHVQCSTTVDQPAVPALLADGKHNIFLAAAFLTRTVPLHVTDLLTSKALALKTTTLLVWYVPLSTVSSVAFEPSSVPGTERFLNANFLLLKPLVLLEKLLLHLN